MTRDDGPPEVVPVFPLPDLVFFPGMILPLRVFEPRYLELVRTCREGFPWLVVALLKPGFEADYFEAPAIHDIATVGKILEFTDQNDGTVHIQVQGKHRVHLDEVESDRMFRRVRIQRVDEDADWLAGEAGAAELRAVLRLAARVNLIRDKNLPPGAIPDATSERVALVNALAGRVPAEARERQAFLEAGDYAERLKLVHDQVQILANTIAALARLPKPDDPGLN